MGKGGYAEVGVAQPGPSRMRGGQLASGAAHSHRER